MNKWIKLIQQKTFISGFNNKNSCISEWVILEILKCALTSRHPQFCLTEIQAFKNTFCISLSHFPWASLLSQMVKNPPAMLETQVWSLGQEDALEKGMATHSSILAWRIPRTEDHGRLQSMESQRVRHDWATNTLFSCWVYLYFQLLPLLVVLIYLYALFFISCHLL